MRSILPTNWCGAGRCSRLVPLFAVMLSAMAPAGHAQGSSNYRLFRRMMPGGTRAEIETAMGMTFQAFLDQQIAYSLLADAEGGTGMAPGVLDHFEFVDDLPIDIFNDINADPTLKTLDSLDEMENARLWRWVYSEQGLYETLTWEWDRHFNIDQYKRGGWFLYPYWNRVATRTHALGQFRDLLLESSGEGPSRAASMYIYLDNLLFNSCSGPTSLVNENYAREVLELHTLGLVPVGPGGNTERFLEADVRTLARILSGRGFDGGPTLPPTDQLMVLFDPAEHCALPGAFLGRPITPDPATNSAAISAFDIAITVRKNGVHLCADFIANKLVAAFLTDEEVLTTQQRDVVNQAIADATLAFGATGNIEAMLRAILTKQNIDDLFPQSNPWDGPAKYMEPAKFVSSLLQAAEAVIDPLVDAPVSAMNARRLVVVERLRTLGQPAFNFPAPDGYPQEIDAWVQNQPGRWSFAHELFEPQGGGSTLNCTIDGVDVNVDALYAQMGTPSNPSGFVLSNCGVLVSRILAGGGLDPRDVNIIQLYADFLDASGRGPAEIKWRALALGAMAPSFSLY